MHEKTSSISQFLERPTIIKPSSSAQYCSSSSVLSFLLRVVDLLCPVRLPPLSPKPPPTVVLAAAATIIFSLERLLVTYILNTKKLFVLYIKEKINHKNKQLSSTCLNWLLVLLIKWIHVELVTHLGKRTCTIRSLYSLSRTYLQVNGLLKIKRR